MCSSCKRDLPLLSFVKLALFTKVHYFGEVVKNYTIVLAL